MTSIFCNKKCKGILESEKSYNHVRSKEENEKAMKSMPFLRSMLAPTNNNIIVYVM